MRIVTRSIAAIFVQFSLALPAAPASADPVAAADASLALLRQAVQPQRPPRDGRHIALLAALRQLRDPAMKPLLQQLTRSDDWATQVHAVLGLAELAQPREVDVALFPQLKAEAQEAIIAGALDLEMLSVDQLLKLASMDGLPPTPRLFVLAELVSLQQSVSRTSLVQLTSAEDLHLAGLACALLAQLGDSAALHEFTQRLAAAEIKPAQRAQAIAWLSDAIRRYKLTAALDVAKAALADQSLSEDVRFRAAFTLLQLQPDEGLPALVRLLDANRSTQNRLTFGLILLEVAHSVPAAAFDQIRAQADEDLFLRITKVGKALAQKQEPMNALLELLDFGHARASEAAMRRIQKLPPRQREAIYRALIARARDQSSVTGHATSLAIEAVSKLHDMNSQAVVQSLAEAEDDCLFQQTLLLGLFESRSAEAAAAAAALPRRGSGRADCLTLLIIAKNAQSLQPADVQQLGKIASGGAQLSQSLQIQAAWLYLKHTGQLDRVVTLAQPSQ